MSSKALFKTKVIEKDGIKFLDIEQVYDVYHEGNGGRMTALYDAYIAEHDETNSPAFDFNDVLDLYGTVLEKNNNSFSPEDLIITGIYAGLALGKEYDAIRKINARYDAFEKHDELMKRG